MSDKLQFVVCVRQIDLFRGISSVSNANDKLKFDGHFLR
jgi:hypothetical protein